jgi:release factor glutamine methyltransferase
MTESELLFTEIFNLDRLNLYLNKELPLDNTSSSFISSVLRRRIKGEPLQYILGKTEFMGLEFKVNKDVFIPRPETEILVETAIKSIKVSKYQSIRVLDIGTGSGNIAISLAKFVPQAEIFATDISEEALEVATENAKLNNVKINFIQSGLFDTYGLTPTTYNLIISNPPYIPISEIEKLQLEIKYEPRIALDGGEDGLDFYRKIIKDSVSHLEAGGFLILEIGFNQRMQIEKIFQKSKNFEIIEVVKDYSNIDRVIVARKKRNG